MPFIHRPRRTYSTDKGKKKRKPMVNKPTVNKPTLNKQTPKQKSTVINNQPTIKDSIMQGAGIGMGAAVGSAAVNSLLNSTSQQVEQPSIEVKNNVCNLFTEAYIKCINNQTNSCKEIEYQLLNCLQNQ